MSMLQVILSYVSKSYLQSEKILSLEAADALEKIKTTFEMMDKNATTMKKKSEQPASNLEFAVLSKSIAEMSTRLNTFQKHIDQQRLDIDSNLAASISHQDSVKSASTLSDDRYRQVNEKLESFSDTLSELEQV